MQKDNTIAYSIYHAQNLQNTIRRKTLAKNTKLNYKTQTSKIQTITHIRKIKKTRTYHTKLAQ